MCGIIGYTGDRDVLPVLLDGLATLEYRGYDSAGVVVITGSASPELRMVKRAGKLDQLQGVVREDDLHGTVGLGHTRWATHGQPTDRNAHPHLDQVGDLAFVHNGIIENYAELRAELEADGVSFLSETDTEVATQLLARLRRDEADLAEAVRALMRRLEGQFAFAVVDRREPDRLVAARRGAPLVLGRADGANLLASDVAGLIAHTRDVESLLDDQVAVLTPDGIEVTDVHGAPSSGQRFTVDWDITAAEKQGYPHFMLKEIHEQPQAIADTLLARTDPDGRIVLDELRFDGADLRSADKVYVVACGTSYHAGLVAKHAIEHWAGIGVEVEIASEFRYRDPILTPHTIVVAISQSGETTDTIAAAAHARDQRARVVAISNVVGSTLTREADAVLYTRAGPEIAVASTKAFTTQIAALGVLALFLAQERRKLFPEECRDQLARLEQLPELMEQVLEADGHLAELAERIARADYVMFIGRHNGVPIALEGALKLKEISYLHAEGFPAGEMKHGPIALIDSGGPVIAIATRGHVHSKVVSNIQEVKARGAEVTAIATEGDTAVKEHADHVVYVPEVHELLYPILTVLPLQAIAYHAAVLLGRDVDQPRNLAKTVTVE
ncbi:glutamine--fructose-6-phosphate transaminase (isomerizing) [Egibacter rhizosphaerae]|uniref:Glutamine--fructose-6-phosphate aminotransferase [isomerizing] n=1 Tax=Egibacter rhizosphaerae TaxID=1670831 RepID=A0A411YHJ5_9ACTN|nr:glutamine--fructose-6-phosphate transaminase (isomerizing) [Egibacter rhizosphaerae]QBI20576.1 glutamine--fructose-6-phosphate transaminase (isomerizing) [Egibacter rhizosphaerae]